MEPGHSSPESNPIAEYGTSSANDGNSVDDVESSNSLSENLPQHEQDEEQISGVTEREVKKEIVSVICKALMLVNQMQGSLHDFEDVLTFAKDLFFRSHHNSSALKYWPRN